MNGDKRILKIPVDKLRVTPGGRLDYPEAIPVCTNASFVPECMRCRLIISSIVYNKLLGSHTPLLFQKCKHNFGSDIFHLPSTLAYTLERLVSTKNLCDLDGMSNELYDHLYPIILDMYDKDYEKIYEFHFGRIAEEDIVDPLF